MGNWKVLFYLLYLIRVINCQDLPQNEQKEHDSSEILWSNDKTDNILVDDMSCLQHLTDYQKSDDIQCKNNNTGVIYDPLGQTHNPAISDLYFQ